MKKAKQTKPIGLKSFVEFIKESRRRGFTDDEIRKRFHDLHYPKEIVDRAFANINEIRIILKPKLKAAIEKKAKKDKLTFDSEIIKILTDNTHR